MTATASKYRSPYVSEILEEPDRTLDDCAASVAIMSAADWTLGEAITRPDGSPMDVLFLRNALRKRIGRVDGGLTLHDVNDLIRELDPELPPLPRYNGQKLRPGQSSEGATLRLTFEEWKAKVMAGHVSALCGNPAGVKNPSSPLRTKQGDDDYPHVIHVSDGDTGGAVVKDPLTRRKPGWAGERVTWKDLREFTEASKGGDRLFGSPSAIACAVVPVGGETEAARVARKSLATIVRLNGKVSDQRDQTRLATEERDAARVEARLATEAASGLRSQLTAAQARIKELESLPSPDCITQVNAERVRVLDLLSGRFDELIAEVR